MSVWHTNPINDRSRVASLSFIVVVVMVGGLFALQYSSHSRTADILQAVATDSPLPTTESTFNQPRPIQWDGYISRVFAAGEGVEIISPAAPGGVFQAYMVQGQLAPLTSGPVLVHGMWVGYTCAYEGHDGKCVPEVTIQKIESQPIELQ